MGTHSHWLFGLARVGAAVALLALWHGQAYASCGNIVESMVLEMAFAAPEHSAPCCAAASQRAAAAPGSHADITSSPGAGIPGGARLDGSAATRLPDPRLPDRPWRRYCARCARLLC